MDYNHKDGDDGRRQEPRIASLCLVSYVEKDGEVQKSPISMARTLNISRTGVKLEVIEPVAVASVLELEIAIKEETYVTRGKVIYCREISSGLYTMGLQFEQPVEGITQALSEDTEAPAS